MRPAADWEGFRTAPEEFVDGGDTIVVLGHYSGTYKVTGKTFRAPFAHVWKVRDGRAIRYVQYTDTLLVQQARTGEWHVPFPLLLVTAFFGGVIGVVVAGTLEYDALRDLGTLPTIVIAVIEESAKLLVPVLLLTVVMVRHGRRVPSDGVLIGIASGVGFAALETMGYAFTALLRSQGNIGAVEETLFIRGLTSPAGHTPVGRAADHRHRTRWLTEQDPTLAVPVGTLTRMRPRVPQGGDMAFRARQRRTGRARAAPRNRVRHYFCTRFCVLRQDRYR